MGQSIAITILLVLVAGLCLWFKVRLESGRVTAKGDMDITLRKKINMSTEVVRVECGSQSYTFVLTSSGGCTQLFDFPGGPTFAQVMESR